jgi:hypothetical protein
VPGIFKRHFNENVNKKKKFSHFSNFNSNRAFYILFILQNVLFYLHSLGGNVHTERQRAREREREHAGFVEEQYSFFFDEKRGVLPLAVCIFAIERIFMM